MLHTKSQGHRPSGSAEEDFLRVFTIYGRGGHLGEVTKTNWTNFRSPILRSLHMKYEFNWPSSFRGEDVWKCWRTTDDRRRTDDGRRSHWYTISSPMSLRLRWANNKDQFQMYTSLPFHIASKCTQFLFINLLMQMTLSSKQKSIILRFNFM